MGCMSICAFTKLELKRQTVRVQVKGKAFIDLVDVVELQCKTKAESPAKLAPSAFDETDTVSPTYRAVVLTSASGSTDAAAFSISATTAPG